MANSSLIRAALALAFAVTLTAPAALAGAEPNDVTGARFSFSVSTSAAPGVGTASGGGRVTIEEEFRAQVRGKWLPLGSSGRSFTAKVVVWRLDFLLPNKILRLGIRVTKGSPGCPVGARGTVTLVDDETPLANSRSSDSVRIRFSGGRCPAFARTWSNGEAGQRARVEIEVER